MHVQYVFKFFESPPYTLVFASFGVYGCTDKPHNFLAWNLNSFLPGNAFEGTVGIAMGNKQKTKITHDKHFLRFLVQFENHFLKNASKVSIFKWSLIFCWQLSFLA